MPSPSPLLSSFYERTPQEVARGLLGARLVRRLDGERLAGYILEAEAYDGEADLACHARAGLTPRTRVMYGSAGHAYLYFTYGAHWMLNAVTGPTGYPAAVLIRALLPCEGLARIAENRPLPTRPRPYPLTVPFPGCGETLPGWTDGPAKLCQALCLTGAHNGLDLCDPGGELWIEAGVQVPDEAVQIGPRVGIDSVPEPWLSMPWRFRVKIS